MKALFDTNILIDYLKGIEAAKDEIDRHDQRLVSIVTWMEVLAGARNEPEADVIDMFLRGFPGPRRHPANCERSRRHPSRGTRPPA